MIRKKGLAEFIQLNHDHHLPLSILFIEVFAIGIVLFRKNII